MRYPKASWYATTAVLFLAFVALPTIARAQSNNTVFACVNKSNGAVKIVAESATCGTNETRVTWNIVGPKGDTGAKGSTGATGATGTGPVSQSCPAGSFVTGFNATGDLVCSCPAVDINFTITAFVSDTFQYWPAGEQRYTDPNNPNCSITVLTPHPEPGPGSSRISYIGGTTFGSSTYHGWSVKSLSGYSSATFTVHDPVCNTFLGISSVTANYPTCSNGSDVASSGLSTDSATFFLRP